MHKFSQIKTVARNACNLEVKLDSRMEVKTVEYANKVTFSQELLCVTFSMCHPTLFVVIHLHLVMKSSLHLKGIMFEHLFPSMLVGVELGDIKVILSKQTHCVCISLLLTNCKYIIFDMRLYDAMS
jgi:hypothetical protein